MINNMIEEDTKHLNDSIIKVVAWMHNTCINKMGGVPLEIVMGAQMEVIRLTMDEDELRDMEDDEVIQEIKGKLKMAMKEIQGKGMNIKVKMC